MSLLRHAFLMAGSDINGIDISDLSVNREKLLLQVLHPRPARIGGHDRELGSGPLKLANQGRPRRGSSVRTGQAD
jgi:hypothetical protein